MADEKSLNLDPITNETGAHPVGTGVGAAIGGAAAGAAAGVVGGPVGAVIGAAIGAVAGGLGGKAVAESVNPTLEEAYWRDNYHREPYYQAGQSYDDYAPAYRMGWSARDGTRDRFEDVEARLENDWGSRREPSSLTWIQARSPAEQRGTVLSAIPPHDRWGRWCGPTPPAPAHPPTARTWSIR